MKHPVFVVLLLLASAALGDAPDVPDDVDTIFSLGDWDVRFTDDNPYDCTASPIPPGVDLDFMPSSVAIDMLSAIIGTADVLPGEPANFITAYPLLGFGPALFDLDFSEDVELFAYHCAPDSGLEKNCDTAVAASQYMAWAATRACNNSEQRTRRIAGHELFHYTQYGYVGFGLVADWGGTAVEGTARMMEDQVYEDLDASNAAFHNEASGYLGDTNRNFFALGDTLGYPSSLGWKYAAEQFGTVRDEPEVGVDFIRRFWERAGASQDNPNTPRVFGETLLEFTGTTLTTTGDPVEANLAWFRRFAFANVLRRFDLSSLSPALQSRYTYIDENDGNGTDYGFASQRFIGVPGGNTSDTVAVAPFGAVNFTALAGDCGDNDVIGFRAVNRPTPADATFPGSSYFGVAGLGDGSTVTFVVNGGSDDFAVATPSAKVTGEGGGLLVTATGGVWGGTFDYDFACGAANMEILFPKTSGSADFKAYVGGPGGLSRQLLAIGLDITGPPALTAPVLKGLQKRDFSVFIGTAGAEDNRAIVLEAVDVGESWVLLVLPPDLPATQDYDLHVLLGESIMASEPGAVSYEERIVDEMLVLDTSGSMADPGANGGEPKLSAAVAAGELLAFRANARGKLGLVTFNSNVSVDASLADVTAGQREVINERLASLTAAGATSIGGGLDAALSEFIGNGSANQEDWALLLTDGRQNTAPGWVDDPNNTNNVRDAYLAQGAHVWAWGLGDDADHVLLQQIAEQTNGFYVGLDSSGSPSPDAPLPDAAASTDPLPTEIADAFLAGNENAEGLERLWEGRFSEVPYQQSITVDEAGIVDATLAVFWATPGADVSVTVTTPEGNPLVDGVDGVTVFRADRSIVFQIPALPSGTWQVSVTSAMAELDGLAVLAGKDLDAAGLRVWFGGVSSDEPFQTQFGVRYLYGRSQPIIATLFDRLGAIAGAQVTAQVEHPDGTLQALPLLDDGEHGDGQANDGVYANRYRRTTSADFLPFGGSEGTYEVTVTALATNNNARPITRIRRRDFVVADVGDPFPDTDGDTLPDRYEVEVGCLDPLVADADKDPDGDGLLTKSEWLIGVDPCQIDTDRGGETDGSEVEAERNPLDPRDDQLNPPIDGEVVDYVYEHLPDAPVPAPDANLIRYPVDPTWRVLHLYRATAPAGPFTLLKTLENLQSQRPYYRDTAVSTGTTYWYHLQPEGFNGAVGSPGPIFPGTPKADPIPPLGGVKIAGGVSRVDSALVTLQLNASPDTALMRIGDTPADVLDAPPVPFSTDPTWTLTPDARGSASVFVQFEDAAANRSPIYHDDIDVVASNALGKVSGIALPEGLQALEGTTIRVLGANDQAIEFTRGDGTFDLLLPPGTYTIVLARSGYETLEVGPFTVEAGEKTELGELFLSLPPPTPVPAVPSALLALFAMLLLSTLMVARRAGRTVDRGGRPSDASIR